MPGIALLGVFDEKGKVLIEGDETRAGYLHWMKISDLRIQRFAVSKISPQDAVSCGSSFWQNARQTAASSQERIAYPVNLS